MLLTSIDAGHLLEGRFRLDALAHARKGTVTFDATDLARGERVAVTVHAAGGPGAREWLLGGVAWAKTFAGPHIAKVIEAGVTPAGEPWIVREPIAAPSLEAHLAAFGALRTGDAVDVVLAVCDALAEAHGKGVLHGGLGPHAVHAAWSASGLVEVKVTGIGTALAEAALTLGATGASDGVLRSPEQVQKGAIDARADVWALGALLHTLLEGRAPFRAEGAAVLLDRPAKLTGVPASLVEIIERALAKDPADRPENVLALADALAFHATSPEFARDRITARRPALRESQALRASVKTSVAAIPLERKPYAAPMRAAEPAPRKKPAADETVLVRAVHPRRRALKVLAAVTAAASIALLALLATAARHVERQGAVPEAKVMAATTMPVPCYPNPR